MKNTSVIILFLLLLSGTVSAQKPPMKYGKVDQVDLDMKVYAQDSSASAVLLCNYGYFDSNNMQFVHQMRIKILKEEGKERGNFSVPAAEKTNVKGQTVNMENGVPVVTKLSKDGIFIERVTKDVYRARVAMPNVKVGSVIDVEFYYSGLPSYWSFQETYPVRWSELILEQNTYFSFRKNFVGYTQLSEGTDERWVAKNVPAFKSEPYINNYENYLTRFNIELSSIHIPGLLYKDYATTWDAVAKILRDAEDFGSRLSSGGFFLNPLEKEIKNSTQVPEERMEKAFAAIKKIKWNNDETLWTTNNGLSSCFNKKIGNVAEVNLSLILLLRKLDIEANPVVLSTRNNGILPPYSVSLDKLNYVIVQATIGDKTYLMDATEEYSTVGLTPERTINGRGLVVKKESIDWADLTPKKKDKTVSIMNVKLTADGNMKGEWEKSHFDYGALDQRKKYKKFNSDDDYLKALESKYIGLSVDNYKIMDVDSILNPVKEKFTISLKNRTTKANNQLFIHPLQFDRYTENPFKAEQRIYPVDFVTAVDQTQLFNLELPDGYTVEQLPKNIKMTLPENSASFSMQSSSAENRVQVLFKLSINKPVFYQPEYENLKLFFDELVKKQAEMLVIKKI
jgi:hypothetical protein